MRGARIGHQDRGPQLFFLTLHWGPGDSGRGLRAARTICSSKQCTSEKTPGKGFWSIETTVCWFLDWHGKKNICTLLKILSYQLCPMAKYSRRHGFDSWVRKIPWRRKWQSTPVFLPGKSHRQRNLVGYSPWGCKESDGTERLKHTFTTECSLLMWVWVCCVQSI